jgi:hypothetical protein
MKRLGAVLGLLSIRPYAYGEIRNIETVRRCWSWTLDLFELSQIDRMHQGPARHVS